MTTSEFQDVNFQDDVPVTTDDMNQMASNQRYLLNKLPRLNFRPATGVFRESGIKMMSGYTKVGPKTTTNWTTNVNFEHGFFTPNSVVLVQATYYSSSENYVFWAIRGQTATLPDYRGFTIYGTVKKGATDNVLHHTSYVAWLAVGI